MSNKSSRSTDDTYAVFIVFKFNFNNFFYNYKRLHQRCSHNNVSLILLRAHFYHKLEYDFYYLLNSFCLISL